MRRGKSSKPQDVELRSLPLSPRQKVVTCWECGVKSTDLVSWCTPEAPEKYEEENWSEYDRRMLDSGLHRELKGGRCRICLVSKRRNRPSMPVKEYKHKLQKSKDFKKAVEKDRQTVEDRSATFSQTFLKG